MGILDNLKNVLSGKKQPDITSAPRPVRARYCESTGWTQQA